MHAAALRTSAGQHALATAKLRSVMFPHAALINRTTTAQREAVPACSSLRGAQQAHVELPKVLQRLGAAMLQQQMPPAAAAAAARSALSALGAAVAMHCGSPAYWQRRGEAALRSCAMLPGAALQFFLTAYSPTNLACCLACEWYEDMCVRQKSVAQSVVHRQ
jgi:hypothetical protein